MKNKILVIFILPLLLGGCDSISGLFDKKEDSAVTETRLDDLDDLEGTISDDMIAADEDVNNGAETIEEKVKSGASTPATEEDEDDAPDSGPNTSSDEESPGE